MVKYRIAVVRNRDTGKREVMLAFGEEGGDSFELYVSARDAQELGNELIRGAKVAGQGDA